MLSPEKWCQQKLIKYLYVSRHLQQFWFTNALVVWSVYGGIFICIMYTAHLACIIYPDNLPTYSPRLAKHVSVFTTFEAQRFTALAPRQRKCSVVLQGSICVPNKHMDEMKLVTCFLNVYLGMFYSCLKIFILGGRGPVMDPKRDRKPSGQPVEPRNCRFSMKMGTLLSCMNIWGCFIHFLKIFIFGG